MVESQQPVLTYDSAGKHVLVMAVPHRGPLDPAYVAGPVRPRGVGRGGFGGYRGRGGGSGHLAPTGTREEDWRAGEYGVSRAEGPPVVRAVGFSAGPSQARGRGRGRGGSAPIPARPIERSSAPHYAVGSSSARDGAAQIHRLRTKQNVFPESRTSELSNADRAAERLDGSSGPAMGFRAYASNDSTLSGPSRKSSSEVRGREGPRSYRPRSPGSTDSNLGTPSGTILDTLPSAGQQGTTAGVALSSSNHRLSEGTRIGSASANSPQGVRPATGYSRWDNPNPPEGSRMPAGPRADREAGGERINRSHQAERDPLGPRVGQGDGQLMGRSRSRQDGPKTTSNTSELPRRIADLPNRSTANTSTHPPAGNASDPSLAAHPHIIPSPAVSSPQTRQPLKPPGNPLYPRRAATPLARPSAIAPALASSPAHASGSSHTSMAVEQPHRFRPIILRRVPLYDRFDDAESRVGNRGSGEEGPPQAKRPRHDIRNDSTTQDFTSHSPRRPDVRTVRQGSQSGQVDSGGNALELDESAARAVDSDRYSPSALVEPIMNDMAPPLDAQTVPSRADEVDSMLSPAEAQAARVKHAIGILSRNVSSNSILQQSQPIRVTARSAGSAISGQGHSKEEEAEPMDGIAIDEGIDELAEEDIKGEDPPVKITLDHEDEAYEAGGVSSEQANGTAVVFMPSNCKKSSSNPSWKKNRGVVVKAQATMLKNQCRRVVRILWRDDGLALDWTLDSSSGTYKVEYPAEIMDAAGKKEWAERDIARFLSLDIGRKATSTLFESTGLRVEWICNQPNTPVTELRDLPVQILKTVLPGTLPFASGQTRGLDAIGEPATPIQPPVFYRCDNPFGTAIAMAEEGIIAQAGPSREAMMCSPEHGSVARSHEPLGLSKGIDAWASSPLVPNERGTSGEVPTLQDGLGGSATVSKPSAVRDSDLPPIDRDDGILLSKTALKRGDLLRHMLKDIKPWRTWHGKLPAEKPTDLSPEILKSAADFANWYNSRWTHNIDTLPLTVWGSPEAGPYTCVRFRDVEHVMPNEPRDLPFDFCALSFGLPHGRFISSQDLKGLPRMECAALWQSDSGRLQAFDLSKNRSRSHLLIAWVGILSLKEHDFLVRYRRSILVRARSTADPTCPPYEVLCDIINMAAQGTQGKIEQPVSSRMGQYSNRPSEPPSATQMASSEEHDRTTNPAAPPHPGERGHISASLGLTFSSMDRQASDNPDALESSTGGFRRNDGTAAADSNGVPRDGQRSSREAQREPLEKLPTSLTLDERKAKAHRDIRRWKVLLADSTDEEDMSYYREEITQSRDRLLEIADEVEAAQHHINAQSAGSVVSADAYSNTDANAVSDVISLSSDMESDQDIEAENYATSDQETESATSEERPSDGLAARAPNTRGQQGKTVARLREKKSISVQKVQNERLRFVDIAPGNRTPVVFSSKGACAAYDASLSLQPARATVDLPPGYLAVDGACISDELFAITQSHDHIQKLPLLIYRFYHGRMETRLPVPRLMTLAATPHLFSVSSICAISHTDVVARFATGGQDRAIYLWDVVTDFRSENLQTTRAPVKLHDTHSSRISLIAYSAAQKWLISTADDCRIKVYDCEHQQLAGNEKHFRVDVALTHLHVNAGSPYLIATERKYTRNQFSVYDLRSQPRAIRTFGYDQSPTSSKLNTATKFVKGSFKDLLFARGDKDGSIRIWDLRQDGEPMRTIPQHQGPLLHTLLDENKLYGLSSEYLTSSVVHWRQRDE